MAFKYDDIEFAYLYANMSPEFSYQAILCKDTGKIYYASGDDEDEIPEAVYDSDECIALPNKRDLNLGNHLVFEFVEENLPELYEHVRRIFRSRGAYSRYKDLLEEKGLMQRWYDFENEKQVRALKEWCADNNIELEES